MNEVIEYLHPAILDGVTPIFQLRKLGAFRVAGKLFRVAQRRE